LALGFAAVLAALLAHYPVQPTWIAAPLAVYVVFLWRAPALWLLVVPALLPVLDFSVWTGWFYVREIDFLILATLAVGYWKSAPLPSEPRLSVGAKTLLVLLVCSYMVSASIGAGGISAIDANSFATYQSPFNSIRILMGFVWAILLLPLLLRSVGDDGANVRRYFYPGMVLGLAFAAAVTLWERLAFTGLTDFTSDYRAAGSFSDMHVGGAGLDAYLMLALPFVAVWGLISRKLSEVGAASLIFVLGTYATLVTFTRSTYLAYGIALAVVLAGYLRVPRAESSARRGAHPMLAALVMMLIAYLLMRVFSTGGYRTLVAATGMFAAALFTGAAVSRNLNLRKIAYVAIPLGGAMLALMLLSPRTSYLSYVAALTLLMGGVMTYWMDSDRQRGIEIAMASFALLALGSILIAWHWGGMKAAIDAIMPVAIAVCLVVYNWRAARPLWSMDRHDMTAIALVAVALVSIIPVVGNDRMQQRFTEVKRDLATRMSHWQDGLDMITPGWISGAFGMGLGSFPQRYFWGNSKSEIPGLHIFNKEGDNTFLRIGGPRYEIGHGESLRVFQMIELQPDKTYQLLMDRRSNSGNANMLVGVCEKWLIYAVACLEERGLTQTKVDNKDWSHYSKSFNSGKIGQTYWFGKRTVQLALSTERAGTYVDIDNLALIDEQGRNLIRNGGFSDGHERWYFTSDHHHLPWHAKNMFLHVLFEQGWFGLILFTLFFFNALLEFASRTWRGDLAAAAPFAALAGLFVVGMFDSVLDMPRLTLLLYLVGFLALIRNRAGRNLSPT
jgi:hypothetical protein